MRKPGPMSAPPSSPTLAMPTPGTAVAPMPESKQSSSPAAPATTTTPDKTALLSMGVSSTSPTAPPSSAAPMAAPTAAAEPRGKQRKRGKKKRIDQATLPSKSEILKNLSDTHDYFLRWMKRLDDQVGDVEVEMMVTMAVAEMLKK